MSDAERLARRKAPTKVADRAIRYHVGLPTGMDSATTVEASDWPHLVDAIVSDLDDAGLLVESRRHWRPWHGMLCAETREEIADRMSDLLAGRYFTYVACNSFHESDQRFSAVDVHTGQYLTRPIEDYNDAKSSGLTWRIRDYSMGVYTEAKTQAEGREGKPHDYVCVTIEQNRMTIDHFAIASYALRWIFVIEDHTGEGPDPAIRSARR